MMKYNFNVGTGAPKQQSPLLRLSKTRGGRSVCSCVCVWEGGWELM